DYPFILKKNFSLPGIDWVGTQAPYTQSLQIAGLLSDDAVVVLPDYSKRDAYQAAAVRISAQANASLTFAATTTPTTMITGKLIIVR
ncbi:MAG: hypothetical protein RSD95_17520, partial [Clostridia bacterium]